MASVYNVIIKTNRKDNHSTMLDKNESVISQFTSFIHSTGIKPKYSINIQADGKLHRFAVEGDRGAEVGGAYCLHLDGCPTGYVQSWRQNIKEHWKYSFTEDERREYGREQHNAESRAQREAERAKHEALKAEEQKRQEKAQLRTRLLAMAEYKYADTDIWRTGYLHSRFVEHSLYLPDNGQFSVRYKPNDYNTITYYPLKRCTGTIHGGQCQRNELLVPFIDVVTGEFRTLQRVFSTPDGNGKFLKRFYGGLPLHGAAHALIPEHSENAKCVFVCEGIATGLAIAIDIQGQYPIFCTGSCGNLMAVCKALRTRYEGKRIHIVADNDTHGHGQAAAEKCRAEGYADAVILPEGMGQDWFDDLALRARKG